jgi:TonB-linked SusC/RagA family outer membrane protein
MKKLLLFSLGFLLSMQIFAQNKTVTGKVVDENNNPIVGAIVNVGKINTTSGADGSFSLVVPNGTRRVNIGNSNFENTSFEVGASNEILAKLKEIQIIVTGYQKVKKTQFSGAATTVSGDKIRGVPVASFDQILQGRSPGLNVLSGSGQPGSAAAVTIRGSSSINGGSAPLYILDGIPVEAGVFQSINPNNFESVDILRDAISTAQYGSRGATGVIIATTKRGSSGKAKINFLYQTGQKFKPQFKYDMMNAAEFMKAQEAVGIAGGGGVGPGWLNSPLNPTFAAQTLAVQNQRRRTFDSLSGINNNYDDNFFRTGKFDSYDLTISGGQGKLKFLTALGMFKEEAIIRRSDLKRFTLQNNIDYKDERLTILSTTTVGYTKRSFQQSAVTNSVFNPFLSSRLTAPYYTPKLPNGQVNYTGTGLGSYGPYLIDAMEKDQNYNDQLKTTLGVTADYKVFKNFTIGTFGAVDFRETQGTFYANPNTITNTPLINAAVRTQGGSITESLGRFLQVNGRMSLTYAKTFNQKHDVNVLGFYETIQTFTKSLSQQGFNTDPRRPNTFAGVLPVNTGNATNYFANASGNRSRRTLQSVAGIVNYAYDGKYVANVVYRVDGASSLPEDNRWQGFYAFGGTWNAHRENFLKDKKNINALSLKVSYGLAANADNFPFGDFGYLETYGSGIYIGAPTTNNSTISVSNPGNPDGNWEYTKTANIGIEYGFFNNRISGDVQIYNKKTENTFVSQTVSATSGFGNGFALNLNAAELQNKGIELNVNVEVLRKKDLTWKVGFAGAYNRNRVTSLGSVSNFERGTERITVGLPLGSHFQNGWAGVDATTGKPLYIGADGVVTDQFLATDKTQNWGTSEAPYTGGISSSLRFKDFDLSALFSFQQGSNRINNLEFFVENTSFIAAGYNGAKNLDFWKKPGDVTRLQSAAFGNQFTSKYVQDASFLRFRNLSLSYSLPKLITNKLKISNCRFFAIGQNLAVWSTWKGYDPEDDNNISLSEFPNPRSLTFGLDITF